MRSATATIKRCSWVSLDDLLMLQYHDREWGVPVHDDRKHFEFLVLEAAQAGLSWTIVLKKREGYRRAFDEFDPEKIARFSARRIEKLTSNSAIIRNRMKIEAAVRNARAFLKIQEEFGSFDSYCWRFVDGRPKLNRWKTMRQIPATSHESDAFSKDLKHRRFSFVGSFDGRLRPHAGRGNGKRSPRRLFPLSRGLAVIRRHWRRTAPRTAPYWSRCPKRSETGRFIELQPIWSISSRE
jgi:DNA-3-methyladenine glycosylase I